MLRTDGRRQQQQQQQPQTPQHSHQPALSSSHTLRGGSASQSLAALARPLSEAPLAQVAAATLPDWSSAPALGGSDRDPCAEEHREGSPDQPPGSERLLAQASQLRNDPEILRARENTLGARETDLQSREANLRVREQAAKQAEALSEARLREARESLVAAEEALRREQAELAAREKELAGRERRLAERESDVHSDLRAREQQLLERERRLSEREEQWRSHEEETRRQQSEERKEFTDRQAELTNRWRDLSDRQEQWRSQQLKDREELEALHSRLDQSEARFKEEESRASAQFKDEEERLREVRRQLDDRDLRWAEARKEQQVLKQHVSLMKPRISPRTSQDKQDLQRQLEEQNLRMHDIKRKAEEGQPPSIVSGFAGGPQDVGAVAQEGQEQLLSQP